jgi:hypothetical protein
VPYIQQRFELSLFFSYQNQSQSMDEPRPLKKKEKVPGGTGLGLWFERVEFSTSIGVGG